MQTYGVSVPAKLNTPSFLMQHNFIRHQYHVLSVATAPSACGCSMIYIWRPCMRESSNAISAVYLFSSRYVQVLSPRLTLINGHCRQQVFRQHFLMKDGLVQCINAVSDTSYKQCRLLVQAVKILTRSLTSRLQHCR